VRPRAPWFAHPRGRFCGVKTKPRRPVSWMGTVCPENVGPRRGSQSRPSPPSHAEQCNSAYRRRVDRAGRRHNHRRGRASAATRAAYVTSCDGGAAPYLWPVRRAALFAENAIAVTLSSPPGLFVLHIYSPDSPPILGSTTTISPLCFSSVLCVLGLLASWLFGPCCLKFQTHPTRARSS
jgi:hypothetical protein